MRLKLNVASIEAREAQRLAAIKPPTGLKLRPRGAAAPDAPKITQAPPTPALPPLPPSAEKPAAAPDYGQEDLKNLWLEMGEIKRKRGKLSTQTAILVKEVEAKLRAQSPAVADEFLKGLVPVKELADHYAAIQALTDQAIICFDAIRYFEQNGQLPTVKNSYPEPVLNISKTGDGLGDKHHEIRRLDDMIYKTKKRMDKPRAKPSKMLPTWKVKLALAQARRDEVKQEIKALQNDQKESGTPGGN